jgi:rubrerythrin
MQDRTFAELAIAFAAESASAARNDLHARRLQKKGRHGLAAALRAVAESERIMARRMLMVLRGKIGDAESHLDALKARKRLAARDRFPDISHRLDQDGQGKSADTLAQFGLVTDNQLNYLEKDYNGATDASYRVCTVCGYIVAGAPPENCPVCNAVTTKFTGVD